ncbi:hypothetical protein ACLMJK_005847 [Lecanora helva]
MRLVWVPQWTVLPVIVEDREMVDENIQRGRLPIAGQQMDPSIPRRLSDGEGPLSTLEFPDRSTENVSFCNAPYHVNPNGVPAQQQFPSGSSIDPSGHQTGRGQPPGVFGMSGIAGALPDYQASVPNQILHHDQQRFLAGTPGSASTYHPQQFHGQSSVNAPSFSAHPSQYPQSYQQGYGVQQSPQSHPSGQNSLNPSYPGGVYFPAQQQQYLYYPGYYAQGMQAQHGTISSTHGHGSYPHQAADMTMVSSRLPQSSFPTGLTTPYTYGSGGTYLRPSNVPVSRRESSNSSTGSIPSTPRGPPRKPKQSGHALWIGNLPSGTVINDLKDHFSREATKDIESVFLISKSNCAFVNYRTESSCAAAMARFHDSRFHGVRLVCRLRRSGAAAAMSGSGIPTGPAALMPTMPYNQTAFEAVQQNREVSSEPNISAEAEGKLGQNAKVTDRYFVMKSLTVEDMELSVRNCIWATQAHNEEALNKAYENAEKVYLVFSANKSGEYFGLARMASPITDETAAGLDWAPRGETIIDDPEIPRSIPTAPTEFAPKGRIIDDSARGTIFWEADLEDEELAPIIDQDIGELIGSRKAEEQTEDIDEQVITAEAQAFGKPFKIEWISTNRLPFYRTRGLRNPWNANREVKIARDGTEIETSVGRRLVQMFQKPLPLEGSQQPTALQSAQVY